eukprot:scaffold10781_cov38-Phaeocystis_antarctica.AAC.2
MPEPCGRRPAGWCRGRPGRRSGRRGAGSSASSRTRGSTAPRPSSDCSRSAPAPRVARGSPQTPCPSPPAGRPGDPRPPGSLTLAAWPARPSAADAAGPSRAGSCCSPAGYRAPWSSRMASCRSPGRCAAPS